MKLPPQRHLCIPNQKLSAVLNDDASGPRLTRERAKIVQAFLRNWLKIRRIKAVIPSTATRTVPYPIDRAVYRRRNLIGRLFCRLKNWRRLATRYDRLARNYLAALALVAVVTDQPPRTLHYR
jgi:hypothetical protein